MITRSPAPRATRSRTAPPARGRLGSVLALQRMVGNRAVRALVARSEGPPDGYADRNPKRHAFIKRIVAGWSKQR